MSKLPHFHNIEEKATREYTDDCTNNVVPVRTRYVLEIPNNRRFYKRFITKVQVKFKYFGYAHFI